MLGALDPERVVATHVNTDPLAIALIGEHIGVNLEAFAASEELSEHERERIEYLVRYSAEGEGYLQLQSTRPQTIAFSLTDSPVAQLAWIVEKFREWTDPGAELPEDAVDRDQLLTNVSIYWFTRTGASAANFLYEAANSSEWLAPSGDATGMGGLRGRPARPTVARPRGANRALVRVRAGRPFCCHGGARPARRRHADVLPRLPVSIEIAAGLPALDRVPTRSGGRTLIESGDVTVLFSTCLC